jgi:hypothetical protein
MAASRAAPQDRNTTTCFRLTRQLLPYLCSTRFWVSGRDTPRRTDAVSGPSPGAHFSRNKEDMSLDGPHASRECIPLHKYVGQCLWKLLRISTTRCLCIKTRFRRPIQPVQPLTLCSQFQVTIVIPRKCHLRVEIGTCIHYIDLVSFRSGYTKRSRPERFVNQTSHAINNNVSQKSIGDSLEKICERKCPTLEAEPDSKLHVFGCRDE